MLRFIQMEFFKIKSSRTFIITIIGALLMPILNTIITIFYKGGNVIETMNGDINTYLTLFSIIFGAAIINYLFTIDIETRTLKSIIPLPVSRMEYIIGKLITLLIWMIILVLITMLTATILYPLVGMSGFDINLILQTTGKFLLGTLILFLTLIPLVFVIIATKNHSATLVLAVLFIFANISIPFYKNAEYIPWNIPAPLATNTLTFSPTIEWTIVILTGLIGFILVKIWINKKDIPL